MSSLQVITDDPTLVNDASPVHPIGEVRKYKHPTYGWWTLRYVKFVNAIAYVAGHVCSPTVVTNHEITNDCTGGAAEPIAVIFAGMALRVMTENYYGWALIYGYYPSIKTSGADDIAVGESLIMHATTNGTCDGVAANAMTTSSFGIAYAVDDNDLNTVAGFIGQPAGTL